MLVKLVRRQVTVEATSIFLMPTNLRSAGLQRAPYVGPGSFREDETALASRPQALSA
jgi:hypothetical protein